jgi:pyrimidine operon attenuation protein/uracil phosphoribosyltransferase
MRFLEKACVMDAARINRAISRLASEIVERNRGVEGLLLVGVRRRGVPIAERVAERVGELESREPQVAAIDVAFYGDDLSLLAPTPIVRESPMPAELTGATVVLVDDVLYTGRTIYAALGHLLGCGTPRRVELAVLIDRGHRELPIQADYIGKIVPTKSEEIVKVMLSEFDDAEKVLIVECDRDAGGAG